MCVETSMCMRGWSGERWKEGDVIGGEERGREKLPKLLKKMDMVKKSDNQQRAHNIRTKGQTISRNHFFSSTNSASYSYAVADRSSIRFQQAEVRMCASRWAREWRAGTRCRWRTARERRRFDASPGTVARRPSEGSACRGCARCSCADASRPRAAPLYRWTRSLDRHLNIIGIGRHRQTIHLGNRVACEQLLT